MKNFKFLILNFAMLIAVFTSCTNEEDIMEIQQDTAESASIITTLNRLNEQYDDDGNVIVTSTRYIKYLSIAERMEPLLKYTN